MVRLFLLVSPILSLLVCQSAWAQPIAQKLQKSKEFYRKFVDDHQLIMQLTSIASNHPLQNELQIVTKQLEGLSEISESYQKELVQFTEKHQEKSQKAQELLQAGKKEEGVDMMLENHEKMAEHTAGFVKKLNDLLLPHQMKRIRQIAKQETLKYQSEFADEFGIPYAVADELELSAAEKQELREAIEKARQKFYAQLDELKEKTHAEILKSVPADKRDRLKEIVGDRFDREANSREWYSRDKKADKPK